MSDSDSPEPTIEYPEFKDGDVVIFSSSGQTWKLHSAVLGNASLKFRGLMDGFPPRKNIKAQRERGDTVKWRFNMIKWEDKPKETRLRSFKAWVWNFPVFTCSWSLCDEVFSRL